MLRCYREHIHVFVQIQATNFYFSGNNFDCNNCNNSCPSSATFQQLSGSGLEFFYDSENQIFFSEFQTRLVICSPTRYFFTTVK
jgi:hypothetical protein